MPFVPSSALVPSSMAPNSFLLLVRSKNAPSSDARSPSSDALAPC